MCKINYRGLVLFWLVLVQEKSVEENMISKSSDSVHEAVKWSAATNPTCTQPACLNRNNELEYKCCNNKVGEDEPIRSFVQSDKTDCPQGFNQTSSFCYYFTNKTIFPPKCQFENVIPFNSYIDLISITEPIWMPVKRNLDNGLGFLEWIEASSLYKKEVEDPFYINGNLTQKNCLVYYNSTYILAVPCNEKHQAVCAYYKLNEITEINNGLCGDFTRLCRQSDFSPMSKCFCLGDSSLNQEEYHKVEFLYEYQNNIYTMLTSDDCSIGLEKINNTYIWTTSKTEVDYDYWAPNIVFDSDQIYGASTPEGWILTNEPLTCFLYEKEIEIQDPSLNLTFNREENLFRLEILNPKGLKWFNSRIFLYCFTNAGHLSLIYRYEHFIPIEDPTGFLVYQFEPHAYGPGHYWCESFTYDDSNMISSQVLFVNQSGKFGSEFVAFLKLQYIKGTNPLSGGLIDLLDRIFFFNLMSNNTYTARIMEIIKVDEEDLQATVNVHFTRIILQSKENNSPSSNADELDQLKTLINHTITTLPDIKLEIIDLRSTSFCPKEVTNNFTWSETGIGQIAKEYCFTVDGTLIDRFCDGDFISGAHWDEIEETCKAPKSSSTFSPTATTTPTSLTNTMTTTTITSDSTTIDGTTETKSSSNFSPTATTMPTSVTNTTTTTTIASDSTTIDGTTETKNSSNFSPTATTVPTSLTNTMTTTIITRDSSTIDVTTETTITTVCNTTSIGDTTVVSDSTAADVTTTVTTSVSKVTTSLKNLLNQSDDNASEILSKLSEISEKYYNFTSDDVYLVGRILEKISNHSDLNLDVLAHIINNLHHIERSILAESEIRKLATDSILHSVDVILQNHKYEQPVNVTAENFMIFITDVIGTNFSGLALFENNVTQILSGDIDVADILRYENLNSALILKSSLKQQMVEDSKVIVTIFPEDSLFNEKNVRAMFVSKIFAIILPEIEEYAEPVLIIHKVDTEHHQRNCVHWFYNKTQNVAGRWKKDIDGANLTNFIQCEFWHTTHFALLLLDEEMYHYEILDWITTINCGLSMFGLISIIFTAILFKRWRTNSGNQILLNFVFALILQISIFYISNFYNKKSDDYFLCTLIGIILHYSVVSQFCWMFIIAILQFKRFVEVLKGPPQHVLLKGCLCGWLLPCLPVACVYFLDNKNYVNGHVGLCYPSDLGLYLGIWLPIGIVVVINTVIFVYIVYSVVHKKTETSDVGNCDVMFQWRLAILLFSMLGLTWAFGFLAELNFGIIFVYLFCFTATLQGFVMFLFFIVFNTNTRYLYSHAVKKCCINQNY